MSTEAITEEQFLREFTKELHNRNVAAFIGAGFSMSTGYVDWKTLLKHVIDDLGLDSEKEHDLVSVAPVSYTHLDVYKRQHSSFMVRNTSPRPGPWPT